MLTSRPSERRPAPRPPRRAGGNRQAAVVLLVEDDVGDQILIQEALQSTPGPKRIEMVGDGEEALEYLYRQGRYSDPVLAPRPDLILLDLNMPRLGGREVAARLKGDPAMRSIPIVAFTTSCREEDVAYCYAVGVNSYIQKPTDFDRLQAVLELLERYWLETSLRLPGMS